MLSVRLLNNSRLLVVKFQGSEELYEYIDLCVVVGISNPCIVQGTTQLNQTTSLHPQVIVLKCKSTENPPVTSQCPKKKNNIFRRPLPTPLAELLTSHHPSSLCSSCTALPLVLQILQVLFLLQDFRQVVPRPICFSNCHHLLVLFLSFRAHLNCLFLREALLLNLNLVLPVTSFIAPCTREI